MGVWKPAKSRFWHYDFQFQGRRFHGSTGVETRRKAEAVERRVREQAALGLDPEDAETLDHFAGRYWAEVAQHRRSARQLRHRLAIIVRLIGKDTRLIDIGTKTIARAIQRRRTETYQRGLDRPAEDDRPAHKAKRYALGPATVNSDIVKPLRAIFNRAEKTWQVRGLQAIDWPALKLEEPTSPIVHFSDAYQRSWLEACGPTEQFALELLLRYGMRFAELFFRPDAFMPDAPGGAAVAIDKRKGGAPMLLFLRQEDARRIAARVGQAQAAGLDSIWIERDERGDLVTVSYPALQSRLRKGAARAGVKHRRLIHAARHHVGTDALLETGDLRKVQRLLGHADIKSTTVYAHALDGGLRALIESRNSPEAAQVEGEFVAPIQPRRRG